MPSFSTAAIASRVTSSLSSSLSDSSLMRSSWESLTVTRRVLVRPPKALPSISPMLTTPTLPPGHVELRHAAGEVSLTSISISLSSSSPSRRRLRNDSRVVGLAAGPTSAVSTRSSAASSALAETSFRRRSRTRPMPTSTRSRMIESTSRPT